MAGVAAVFIAAYFILRPEICPECGAGEIKTYTYQKDPTYCTNPHCPPKKRTFEHEVL